MLLHIVILAAGQGKRMHSSVPKVLHTLAGKPILSWVVETAFRLNPAGVHVIIGHEGAQIKKKLSHVEVNWINQPQPLGTGHAVLQALPAIPAGSHVLVLYGDVPLIQVETLQSLVGQCLPSQGEKAPLNWLVTHVNDPTGYGRMVRDSGQHIVGIVEEKDATATQRTITEINTGFCCANRDDLQRWLPKLSQNNAQNEFYLTDIVAMAAAEGHPIIPTTAIDSYEVQGINDCYQLQQLERVHQIRQATALMRAGVTIADAARIDIRGELHCGQDVFIDVNTVFQGSVTLADHCSIGPNCSLTNVVLGAGSTVLANSVLENCHIGSQCQIGPFARLRPGTELKDQCKVGNFVETKNAQFGFGSKASHLSYLGDVLLGSEVNIGAGTITCNYDGVNKHQTVIEDGVLVGSDTQLVAPVTIGKHATIGAGSTIRKNVPAGELTLNDVRQKTVYGWKRPQKKKG